MVYKSCMPRFPTLTRKPDALVVSGGGLKGIVSLGALTRLRRAHLLDNVRVVVGTSAGALIGAVIATNASIPNALRAIEALDYDTNWDIGRLVDGFGMDDGARLERLIAGIVGDLTFDDVKTMHGIELFVTCSNVTRNKVVYFGPSAHGPMKVAQALRMSCSIPLVYTAVKYKGDVYVDGGVHDNYAWKCALDEGATNVMGIVCHGKKRRRNVRSLDVYLSALLSCGIRMETPNSDSVSTVHLTCPLDVPALPREISRAEIDALFKSGEAQASLFLKKLK